MICNELYNGQGLGNQLWNYAVTRVLADRLNCEFSILGRERFKGKRFMTVDFGVELRGGSSPEGGPPTTLPIGITKYYRERRENLRQTTTDVSRTDPDLLVIRPGTKFDGNCQSVNYLDGYRDELRTWITINKNHSQPTDENTCLIHIRGGDFAGLKNVFLRAEYYLQAMTCIRQQHPGVNFSCVTDQPELVHALLPDIEIIGASLALETDSDKATHHRGGPVAIDFSLLAQAKYLIIPNSSFSWWAAYLNPRAEIVVAPKYWAAHNISDGYWSTSDMVTTGFTYLDRQGNTWTAEQCLQEKNRYEAVHPDMFTTTTNQTPTLNFASRLKRKLLHF